MPGLYDYAELIAALWKLGGEKERMPTSHGILDKALQEIVSRPEFPEAYRDGLTFKVTSVGLRCFELPDILLAAQDSLITSEPNPTYLTTDVTLDEDAARQIVVGAGLRTRDAKVLGEALRAKIAELRERWAVGNERMALT